MYLDACVCPSHQHSQAGTRRYALVIHQTADIIVHRHSFPQKYHRHLDISCSGASPALQLRSRVEYMYRIVGSITISLDIPSLPFDSLFYCTRRSFTPLPYPNFGRKYSMPYLRPFTSPNKHLQACQIDRIKCIKFNYHCRALNRL